MTKRLSILLTLGLIAVLALGGITAFAAETKEGKMTPAASTAAPDIKAIAAEVLGVEVESLEALNNVEELYEVLAKADTVEAFKAALIEAKETQYAAKGAGGKASADTLAERLAKYIETINAWDGTTELIVTSHGISK